VRAEVGQPRSGYVHERNPSRTSHACGKVYKGNRVARGLYRCACGWKAQADPNGALNLDEGTFPVSPVFTGVARTWKGSRGRGARPGALSFRLRWPTVHQPSCFPKGAPRGRESLPSSLIGWGEDLPGRSQAGAPWLKTTACGPRRFSAPSCGKRRWAGPAPL